MAKPAVIDFPSPIYCQLRAIQEVSEHKIEAEDAVIDVLGRVCFTLEVSLTRYSIFSCISR